MSKFSEAFKAIAILEMSAMCDDSMSVDKAEELRQIVEKELNRLEKLETKYVELLDDYGLEIADNLVHAKALEIIKTVCPNIFWIVRTKTYKGYKRKCKDDTLLENEYYFLREVLLWVAKILNGEKIIEIGITLLDNKYFPEFANQIKDCWKYDAFVWLGNIPTIHYISKEEELE